jgi:hypothetical protein
VSIIVINRCGFIDLCITLHHLQIGLGGANILVVINGRLLLLVERHLMKFLNLLEFLTIYSYLQN